MTLDPGSRSAPLPGHPCSICAGCTGDADFDYCRACGYGQPEVSPEPKRSPLQQAIESARGGPAPGPTEGW